MLTTILYILCWFVMFMTTFSFVSCLHYKQNISIWLIMVMAAAWTGLVTHWLGVWC